MTTTHSPRQRFIEAARSRNVTVESVGHCDEFIGHDATVAVYWPIIGERDAPPQRVELHHRGNLIAESRTDVWATALQWIEANANNCSAWRGTTQEAGR